MKREGASQEELLVELSEVLREKFDLDLSFEGISETTQTLVLRGSIGAVPPDDERDGRRVLHVFTDSKNEDPLTGAGGGPFPNTEVLFKLLSSQLEMPVVDHTTGAVARSFHVQFHRSAYVTRRLDLLIQNLEFQTDLDIAIEERLEPMVVVSKNPP